MLENAAVPCSSSPMMNGRGRDRYRPALSGPCVRCGHGEARFSSSTIPSGSRWRTLPSSMPASSCGCTRSSWRTALVSTPTSTGKLDATSISTMAAEHSSSSGMKAETSVSSPSTKKSHPTGCSKSFWRGRRIVLASSDKMFLHVSNAYGGPARRRGTGSREGGSALSSSTAFSSSKKTHLRIGLKPRISGWCSWERIRDRFAWR